MDYVSLLLAAIAGFLLSILINRLKEKLTNRNSTRFQIKLPSGKAYDLTTSANFPVVNENKIQNVISSTEEHLKIVREPINLKDILQPSLMLTEFLLEQNGMQVEIEGFNQDVQVFADPLRMKQIILNLLSNASRYSNRNSVLKIIASCTDEFVEMKFVNSITTEQSYKLAERISTLGFEGLYRPLNDSSEQSLGLLISHNLIIASGGDISAHADNGLFTISLKVPLVKNYGVSKTSVTSTSI